MKKNLLKKAKNETNGRVFSIKKPDGTKLIVGYSEKRRKKDASNRKKGIRKLKQKIRSGKLTKESINNRGYNKFLKLKGDVEVELQESKIKEEEKWDGLKGYNTNANLPPEEIVEQYSQLWHIEKAFRISKTDLRIRPMYHFKRRRIESHILIAFVAYTIWKELERLLKEKNIAMSPKRAAELTHAMYEIEYSLPDTNDIKKIMLRMDPEQEILWKAVHD